MRKIIPALIVLSLISIFLGVYIGPVDLTPSDVTKGITYGVKLTLSRFFSLSLDEPPKYFSIIWKIRLPEVLLAYLVGISLASAGVASQALFRNPLADPYIIGISSGAAFGAALSLLVGITYMPYLSLAFSFLSVFIVYSLARTNGKVPVNTLLLAGIAYGFLANAATWYIYVTHPHNAYITWTWLLGSFNGAEWREVLVMFLVSLLGTGFLIRKWRELNLILLGEESIALGLDLHLYRKVFLGVIATLTAFAVYTSGVIGFVGLVSPHIMRIILGPNHRELTPSTALFGGILLVVADLLARTVAKPQVIPVGIITAFMGAPFFLYLLMKYKRGELMR
ncbi:FecCD family ABC transporter permease [Thermococcus peptonophilus]|uniref:Iron ABC transporter n=1 Tax=Thermococcus peptonophilus TaxID=53952 RepID=A0A142CUJ7_9EURY|nr:iron ABC transporter permease [Thermococcus peptonophilus]AMQ18449.1 iron ABC transporter [Thermococcus peptonophilus]